MATDQFSSDGSWTVPEANSSVVLRCYGESGDDASRGDSTGAGGNGGYAEGELAVSEGDTLYIRFDGAGNGPSAGFSANAGDGGNYAAVLQGGTAWADRVIVAGGGGGGGAANWSDGPTNASGGGAGGGAGQDSSNANNASGAGGEGSSDRFGESGDADDGGNRYAAGGGGGGGATGGAGGNIAGVFSTSNPVDASGGGGGGGETPGVTNATTEIGTNDGGQTVEIVYNGTVDDLTATQGTRGEIELTWSDVDWETEYRVLRAETSGAVASDYTEVATLTADTTTYTDTGLEDGERYFYRVEPADGTDSRLSNEDDAVTVLPAPTFGTATPTAATALEVDYTLADDSTDGSVEIYATQTEGTLGERVGETTDLSGSAATVQLDRETVYYLTLRRSTDHASADSAQVAAAICTAPTDLAVSDIRAEEIDLTWVEHSAVAEAHRLRWRPTSEGTFVDSTAYDPGVEAGTADQLRNGEKYVLSVGAAVGIAIAEDTDPTFDVAPGETRTVTKPLTVEDSEFTKPLNNAGTVQPDDA